MSKYFRPISISLSPNVEKDDVKTALNLLIRPWLWSKGKGAKALEDNFKKYLRVKYAYSFNSGRSAFYAILKALDLERGSEVAFQAFTCNAVPNPILWANLEPLYIDCNTDDYNLSPEDLEAKVTLRQAQGGNPKVVIVQHTFGLPANMEAIRSVCAKHNLILIEDCAHSLGGDYGGIPVGTHSKASFFSFGRDKVISSVYGGMAVTNDDKLAKKLAQLQKDFGMPSAFWTLQQILHPILLNYIILPIYNFFDLGKLILVFSQITHILSKAVTLKEKEGGRPSYFPKALPNALAAMALNQFMKLEKFNFQRQRVANLYYENLKGTKFELPKTFENRKNIFLRFTVKHPDAHVIMYEAWHKQNILLGDWYTTPIAPHDTNLKDIKYIPGSCKNAESLAKKTINLPTHINISLKDASRIINFLKKFDK